MNIYKTTDEQQLMADMGKYLTLTADIDDKHRPLCKLVHLPLAESIGEWTEIGEDEAKRIRNAKSAAAGDAEALSAQLDLQTRLAKLTINTMQLTDEQALQVKDLYPAWEECIGQSLAVGFKLQYGGDLYKVIQAHTAQADWKPGTGTASLYALVGTDIEEGEHAGTKEDPIPYEQMMIIEQGKYYTQDGVLYVGLMDAPNGYPNDLKDLATLAQKVEE